MYIFLIWFDDEDGDDSSTLFDVMICVPFSSLFSLLRLPVEYWFDVCSGEFCSIWVCWENVDGGGGGALFFRRVPGDLHKLFHFNKNKQKKQWHTVEHVLS